MLIDIGQILATLGTLALDVGHHDLIEVELRGDDGGVRVVEGDLAQDDLVGLLDNLHQLLPLLTVHGVQIRLLASNLFPVPSVSTTIKIFSTQTVKTINHNKLSFIFKNEYCIAVTLKGF